MEIFNGNWTLTPSEPGAVSGDKEAFKFMHPPNVSEEDVKTKTLHINISSSGNKAKVKISLPGVFEKEENHTLGVEEDMKLPNGKTGKAIAQFANGTLTITVKDGDKEVKAVRYIEGGNMITDLTACGKSCKLVFKKA